MANSYIAAGSAKAMRLLGAGMTTQAMRRNSTLGSLSGPMPNSEAQLNSTIERQSSSDMPIVRTQDLKKNSGDEVEVYYLQPHSALPIMGEEVAQGRGTGMTYEVDRIRANQARFPVKIGGNMTAIRSAIAFANVARPVAQSHAESYLDQSILVHLAGARGFENNANWRLPLASDARFERALVNPVLAPTKNRHYMADSSGNGIKPFSHTGGQVDIASGDVLDMAVVDAVRSMVESMPMPPHAVRIPGDKLAGDSPLRVMLVSPAQYSMFAADDNFRKFQVEANRRVDHAQKHPLFSGEAGLWNGILLMKMPHPIRFYAGNPISYSTDYHTQTEATAVVDPAFGNTHAIDRALLLGGQALAQVFAASGAAHGGMPFFFSHVTDDHGDKSEALVGVVSGCKKMRWNIDHGGGNMRWTDHGVIAIDTAVKIPEGQF